MELLATQPGFKVCNEPLNLRIPAVRNFLKILDWEELYNLDNRPLLFNYFNSFCNGKLRFKNTALFHENYRPFTRRIIFKIIHGCEDQIDWIKNSFNGKIILLFRHPIPVSLSREILPRLNAFINSDYKRHLNDKQIRFSKKIIESGSNLEKGVLSWCFQNFVPLNNESNEWIIITYEQMILDPVTIVNHLTDKLDISFPDRVMRKLKIPSSSTIKCDTETQEFLKNPEIQDRKWLVEKWRKYVNPIEESRIMEMLNNIFDMDIYEAGDLLPNKKYWLNKSVI